MNLDDITIRPLATDDSLEELTDLLHCAYKKLADMGLRYLATHQDVATTRKRVNEGRCFIAVHEDRIVGTINYLPSLNYPQLPHAGRTDVAHFGQMAVDPDFQSKGLGARLVQFVEDLARADGKTEIALDTAETAHHLIEWYTRLGYRITGHADWDVTNYRSVVMSKPLQYSSE